MLLVLGQSGAAMHIQRARPTLVLRCRVNMAAGPQRRHSISRRVVRASDSEPSPPQPPEAAAEPMATFEQAAANVAASEVVSAPTRATPEAADAVAAPQSLVVMEAPPTSGPIPTAKAFLRDNPVAGYSIAAIATFMGVTFVIAVAKTFSKGFTSQGKRTRTVTKNKAVIDELNRYLPSNRVGLTGGVIAGVRFRTGFSPVELFRKYLWYLLRERKFDTEALQDLIALKAALGLTDEQLAEALSERAKRVYKQYGNVMLDTSGMSAAGIERKATARALFSKILYLVECEELHEMGSEAASVVDMRGVFGATEDDVARLRIVSLHEMDLEAAFDGKDAVDGQQQQQQQQEPQQ